MLPGTEVWSRARTKALFDDEQAFIVHRGRRIGFTTFLEQAHAISRSFAGSFGVRHGDRVAVLLDWLWAYVTFQRGSRLITGSLETM